jgi:hypothetical protein
MVLIKIASVIWLLKCITANTVIPEKKKGGFSALLLKTLSV